MGKLTRTQAALAAVVAAMWAASFFVPGLDPSTRIGAQAAMMLILGRIFGIGIARRNGNGDEKGTK